ncbi:hypothetical protein ACFWPJ_26545, partial [Nocardia sp. NPDC058497]
CVVPSPAGAVGFFFDTGAGINTDTELDSLIRHVGAGRIEETAGDLLAAADQDGDGYLSLAEFRVLLDFLSR